MTILYAACIAFGMTVALVSLFSGGGDTDAGADISGDISADVDIGGADAGGSHAHVHVHADGHGHGDGGGSFPYLSPAVLGSFLGAFGAGGLIMSEVLQYGLAAQLSVGIGGGLVMGGLAGFLIQRIVRAAESTSHVDNRELLYSEADVITQIPAKGLGEVALLARGSRMTFPAKDEAGRGIPKNAKVEIVRIESGVAHVRQPIDELEERLAQLDSHENKRS